MIELSKDWRMININKIKTRRREENIKTKNGREKVRNKIKANLRRQNKW